ncbi:MAG: Spo0E family sporulation regulatory protein-aspartic acid phosphatase [Bacilli bacterium]|nr:Spo0E family sporulation regulatory protein-aspartic acid phosphatase [Bacilli bacterium]
MKNNLFELNKELAKKRDELNSLVEKDGDEKSIFEKSVELDNLIMKYLTCKYK